MSEFNLSMGFSEKTRRKKLERQIQAHLPKLFRLARGITDQASDAEDLVHDVCIKALSKTENTDLSIESAFCAYLNRILINTYRDNYRRKLSSPVRPLEYHSSTDTSQNVVEMVMSKEPTPVETMTHRDSSVAIHYALSSLPPEVRMVSVLFLISGLSYKNIAEITDCPIGTIMSRLARGRKLLQNELSNYDPRDNGNRNPNLTGEKNESL